MKAVEMQKARKGDGRKGIRLEGEELGCRRVMLQRTVVGWWGIKGRMGEGEMGSGVNREREETGWDEGREVA